MVILIISFDGYCVGGGLPIDRQVYRTTRDGLVSIILHITTSPNFKSCITLEVFEITGDIPCGFLLYQHIATNCSSIRFVVGDAGAGHFNFGNIFVRNDDLIIGKLGNQGGEVRPFLSTVIIEPDSCQVVSPFGKFVKVAPVVDTILGPHPIEILMVEPDRAIGCICRHDPAQTIMIDPIIPLVVDNSHPGFFPAVLRESGRIGKEVGADCVGLAKREKGQQAKG